MAKMKRREVTWHDFNPMLRKLGLREDQRMSEKELLAIDAGMVLFRYRLVDGAWRTGFFDPDRHSDPRVWLERKGLEVAEVELEPRTQPVDVSDEAWACEMLRRELQQEMA